MDKKELFRAIDACEDRFIREAAEDIQKRKSSIIRRFFFVNSSENAEKDMRKLSGVRVVAAIVICVIAVSYTHLDVYKRQKIAFFDVDGTLVDMEKKIISPKMIETLKRLKKNGIILCIATGRGPYMAVSYTHLDVYKRQVLPCGMV